MKEDLNKLILEEKWRRWHNANNIHLLVEQDPTKVIRQQSAKTPPGLEKTKVLEPAVSVSGRRPVKPDDVKEPESSASRSFVSSDGTELTDLGKVALKANTVWTNHLTQLMNFQAGKQLAQQLGKKLASQTDIDPNAGERIAEAIMKQVLEHLDGVATGDMEKAFPGIFNVTRS